MTNHLLSALERLEALLDTEIEAMSARKPVDDAAVAGAKGRALLALTRLSADLDPNDLSAELRARLSSVRQKLTRESALLRRRLDASQIVVELIADAVLAGDWDGTYAPAPAGRTRDRALQR